MMCMSHEDEPRTIPVDLNREAHLVTQHRPYDGNTDLLLEKCKYAIPEAKSSTETKFPLKRLQ